jgi:hypothetical protein
VLDPLKALFPEEFCALHEQAYVNDQKLSHLVEITKVTNDTSRLVAEVEKRQNIDSRDLYAVLDVLL